MQQHPQAKVRSTLHVLGVPGGRACKGHLLHEAGTSPKTALPASASFLAAGVQARGCVALPCLLELALPPGAQA
jgi:hypothetical protein